MLRRVIALMMQAVSTSETSVNFYQTTRRNIPEDSHLHHHLLLLLCKHKHINMIVNCPATRHGGFGGGGGIAPTHT
jgi:hypothetical protein